MSASSSSAASGRSASALDRELLATLERAFTHHAGADDAIDLADLQRALGLRSEYLARRVLALFDANGDGVVSKAEFVAGARALVVGSDREKLAFAFRLHDHDGDGALDRQELFRMIAISLAESDIVERETQTAEQLTRALLAAADRDGDGRVSFEELVAVVTARPALLRKMTRNEAIWLAPNEDLLLLLDERAAGRKLRRTSRFEGGTTPLVLLALFAAANLALFTASMIRGGAFTTANPFMQAGRATGQCIDFCGALILVPMMRRVLTWARKTWLGRVVPLDDAVDFHRFVGHALFVLSILHSASFLAAFAVGHASQRLAAFLETERGVTGIALLAVFAAMWICSLSFIRRSQRFELFYFTHLLWIAWFVLAIVHRPAFAIWAGVPLAGFLVEQLLRGKRRGPASTVVECTAQRSGVTRLEIARPPGFTFRPGDYVFLRIPAIASREWHPFTISSAPERHNVTFHVRSLGNWTAALRKRAEESADASDLTAFLDGPYGTPTGAIFQSKYAVLIGAGIGVTPFASVLESIVLRGNAKTDAAGATAATGATGAGATSRLERAHFFWLNRDAYSFEWFASLLSDLEAIDRRGLLDVHLCMTAARAGASSLGLEVARELLHASGRSDLITGLRTHTHLGPPDWREMLGTIRQSHAGERVDVYFCGPPGLAALLRPICDELGMSFREERF